MGFIPLDCPYCGRKLASVNENLKASKVIHCPGCKTWIKLDYDPKTGRVSAGRHH